MAKGPEITDEVRMLIASLHKEHPKWTNSMIRNEVSSIMRQRAPSLPKGWPSKFSIDRLMPGIRERVKHSELEPNPLDKPWTIQSMSKSEYRIPPEALPSVLEVWYWAHDENHALTIREAQWAARLYATFRDIKSLYWHAIEMAHVIKRTEDAGVDYAESPNQTPNLDMYSEMTGHMITREDRKTILGWSEEFLRQMDEDEPIHVKILEDLKRELDQEREAINAKHRRSMNERKLKPLAKARQPKRKGK